MKLYSVPFLKILLPYLIGILLFLNLPYQAIYHFIFLFLCVSYIVLNILNKNKTGLYIQTEQAFIYLLLIFLAFETTYFQNELYLKNHYSKFTKEKSATHYILASVSSTPSETNNKIKIPVEIESISEDGENWQTVRGKSIIYISKESGYTLQLNDRFIVKSSFVKINKPVNPNEFDYSEYLTRKNIFRVIYLNRNEDLIKLDKKTFSWYQFGDYLQLKIIEILKGSGLNQLSFSICTALLVGYDDEIDQETLNSFSHSGTLHVLSVSGLHTGIIYGLILFLFQIFDKEDRYKKAKCYTTIVSLFILVCITGFAPAVLRASIMLSFIIIGKTFFKQVNSFNTLFLSAFIILLFNPTLIRDLGFLLSYLAVFGIMYLFPKINTLYNPKNKIFQWAWSSTVLSVSATLFTLPITLYYFHQFPIWFIFTNLIIVPISMIVMILTFLLIITFKISILKIMLVGIIEFLNHFMMKASSITNHSGWGYIDHISFSLSSLFFAFIFMFIFFVFIETKKIRYFYFLSGTVLFWLSISTWNLVKDLSANELVVFKIKQKANLLINHGGYIYYLGDSLTPDEKNKIIIPYLLNKSYLSYQEKLQSNYIKYKQNSIIINPSLLSRKLIEKTHPNMIIIKNDVLKIKDIGKIESHPHIIITGKISEQRMEKLSKKTKEKNIELFYINHQGVYLMNPDSLTN